MFSSSMFLVLIAFRGFYSDDPKIFFPESGMVIVLNCTLYGSSALICIIFMSDRYILSLFSSSSNFLDFLQ